MHRGHGNPISRVAHPRPQYARTNSTTVSAFTSLAGAFGIVDAPSALMPLSLQLAPPSSFYFFPLPRLYTIRPFFTSDCADESR
jgi:hypothetical protein